MHSSLCLEPSQAVLPITEESIRLFRAAKNNVEAYRHVEMRSCAGPLVFAVSLRTEHSRFF